jgi:hypothetical protein
VKGEDLCAGHLGRGIASDPAGYGKRGAKVSGEIRRDRAETRKRRTLDVLAAAVEDLQSEIRAAYEAGLRGEDGAEQRVRVAEMLLSRVHGKPKETQVVEVEMPDDFQALRQMSVRDLAQLYRQLDGDGALAQLLPGDEELAQVVAIEDGPLLG